MFNGTESFVFQMTGGCLVPGSGKEEKSFSFMHRTGTHSVKTDTQYIVIVNIRTAWFKMSTNAALGGAIIKTAEKGG